MICAFDFEAVAVIDATGDFEDHGVVEEIGAGEAKAMVAVGLVFYLLGFLFRLQ